MEICTEPTDERLDTATDPAGARSDPWREWRHSWTELRDSLGSEWSAAFEALSGPGTTPMRKWLGWALYRLAARVNPEIRE